MFQNSCRNVLSATFVHKSFIQMFQKRFTNVSTKLSFSNVLIEMFQKCVFHVSKKLFYSYKLHGKCFRPVSETFITKLLKDAHLHSSTTVRKRSWHFYWNVSKFQNAKFVPNFGKKAKKNCYINSGQNCSQNSAQNFGQTAWQNSRKNFEENAV